LIRRSEEAIEPPPERFVWCFDGRPPEDVSKDVEFVEGLAEPERLLDGRRRTLLVIEDLMCETDDRVTKLFTKGSHHLNASVVYVSQNLFAKNKENRTISLNTHYLVLFKNPRDASQSSHLGRQIYPDDAKYFREAFDDATSKPYGYLLIDLRTTTPDDLRLRTSVFADDDLAAYVKKRYK
jgi:hypothetical protein